MASPELVDEGAILGTIIDTQLGFVREAREDMVQIIQLEVPVDLLERQRDEVLVQHPEDVIAGDPSVIRLLEIIDSRINGVPELTLIVGGLDSRTDHERTQL